MSAAGSWSGSFRPVDGFGQKLDPVPEGVRGVEASRSRNRVILDDLVTGLGKAVAESVDLFNDEGRVGLSLGPELHIDTDMDPAPTSSKPAPAATLKQGRLLLLEHTEDPDEERASFGLFACRHRELNVINDHPRGPSKSHPWASLPIPTPVILCLRKPSA